MINKIVQLKIPNNRNIKWVWLIEIKKDGRYKIRYPKKNILINKLHKKNDNDFGPEKLAPKGSTIFKMKSKKISKKRTKVRKTKKRRSKKKTKKKQKGGAASALRIAKKIYGDIWNDMSKEEKKEAVEKIIREENLDSKEMLELDKGKLSFKDKINLARKEKKSYDKDILIDKYGEGGDVFSWEKHKELSDSGKGFFFKDSKSKLKQIKYIVDHIPNIIAQTVDNSELKVLKILQDQITIYLGFSDKLKVNILAGEAPVILIKKELERCDSEKVIINRIKELENYGEELDYKKIWQIIQREVINKIVSSIMNKSLTALGNKLIIKGDTAEATKQLNMQIQDRMTYKGMTKEEAIKDIARTSSNLSEDDK